MLRVLIVDDSPAVQRTLAALLENDPDVTVVGIASNGAEAVSMCKELMPDLVTMDIFMPVMDGLEATRQIMRDTPTRILIVSSMVKSKDMSIAFEAIRAGAVEVVEKPHGVLRGNYSEVRAALLRLLKGAAEAIPKATLSLAPPQPSAWSEEDKDVPVPRSSARRKTGDIPALLSPQIVCIGGSTGAPGVLAEILANLPKSFQVPIVVAQHIARGFADGMAEWLDSQTHLKVRMVKGEEPLAPGVVLVAPDDGHVEISRRLASRVPGGSFASAHMPSVDLLFSSAAAAYGRWSLGVLLSGMGHDGAQGLLAMREAGGVTVAQDEESSVVWGMPKAAIDKGAALVTMTPAEIVQLLGRLG
ncbi:MAG: chemotaxis-specific protein-glutamate methyltransferase CheB [Deltaproteobacteria bacterium]|nr:chemotaxis-specific protein-glutamate methyltransferase CheB [Deltaproteobacteria bacterium]